MGPTSLFLWMQYENITAGAGVWVGFSRVETTAEAIAALMLASLSSAFTITVVDSILVTRTHGQSLDFAASLQSFCWGLQVSTCKQHVLHTCEYRNCEPPRESRKYSCASTLLPMLAALRRDFPVKQGVHDLEHRHGLSSDP